MMRRAAIVIVMLATSACAAMPAAAQATTSASIHPSFLPNRLGASTAFTVAFGFSGGEEGVPTPLSTVVTHFPAGMRINLAGVGTCTPSRLRSKGPGGCPASSLVGRGHALMEVHAGSQTLPEAATIAVFRAPNQGGKPAFVFYGHGNTPLDQTVLSSAVLQSDSAPYGYKLTVSIPPIPTIMYEPNASFSSMSVTIGNVKRPPRAHTAGSVLTPRSCPAGGFPFAADFTFADHSTTTAEAQLACP